MDKLADLRGWNLVDAPSLFSCVPGLRHHAARERVLLVETSEGRTLLFLRLARGLASLGQTLLPADTNGQGQWLLALESGPRSTSPDVPAIPDLPARLALGVGEWPELWFGETRLGCAVDPFSRDWAWSWSRTCGPVILRIYLNRSREEIEGWLLSRQPPIWSRGSTGLLHSSLWDDSRVSCVNGQLSLSRSYLTPPQEQVYHDYLLLLELAEGALGDLQFDLFDGDYYVFQASGESQEALREYLHARARRGRPHRWNRFETMRRVDARAATVEESAAILGQSMGWGTTSFAELRRRFSETPVPQLPRHLHLDVLELVWTEDVRHQLSGSQKRIQFWFGLH